MILEQIKAAIEGDSIPVKNIALLRAHDEIERFDGKTAQEWRQEVLALRNALQLRDARISLLENAIRDLGSDYRKKYGRVRGGIKRGAPFLEAIERLWAVAFPLRPAIQEKSQ